MVKFRDQLKQELQGEIPENLLELLPVGFQTIGFAIIFNLKEELYPYKRKIAEASLKLVPLQKSVWVRTGKIEGKFRKPSGLELILGDPTSEIEHHENQVKYRFDFTKIMFSKGNIAERKYLAKLIQDGETIVDMFAGIGYFSLPSAKLANPSHVYSIEMNPDAFDYLKINIEINKLEPKITPILGDCGMEVPKLAQQGIIADRIIMGVFPAPYEYIDAALTIVKQIQLQTETNYQEFLEKSQITYKFDVYDRIKQPISNTIIHFEGVSFGKNINEMYQKFQDRIAKKGLKSTLLAFRFVKGFGPKLWHLVLDIAVGK